MSKSLSSTGTGAQIVTEFKILTLLALLAMILGMAACGGQHTD
jgi:hypothetical protein